MKTQNINRFSSLKLNTQLALRNRVVVPPMASGTASLAGLVTNKTIQHYARLGQANAGLIIVEYTYVHVSGRSEENQLGISHDEHLIGLTQLASVIHQSGAIPGIQLTHSGGKSTNKLTGNMLMGPTAISVPVKNQPLEVPRAMNYEDLSIWKNAFVEAAGRAVHAGFKLVEIHAAHGYGFNQWLSPITNKREDEYGSDFQGRMGLLKEVIQTIRANQPQLLISVRIPGQDFEEGGISQAQSIQIAKTLEALGVNIINVSSGIGGWKRPSSRNQAEGYLVEEAAKIQAEVNIPVIGVGGIKSGAYIDLGLKQNHFALAAVGRAILEDPILFSNNELNCIDASTNKN